MHLVDRPLSKGLDVVTHRYSRWLDRQRLHVVEVGRYESVEYLLVDDRTGAETTVMGEPVVSPDGSRLACLVLNLVNAGFARLEISLDRRILNLRRVLTSEPPAAATT